MNMSKMLAALGLALLAQTSWAGEPISDLQAFEASYISCVKQKVANDCLTKILKPHVEPGAQDFKSAPVNEILHNWLSDGLYEAHLIANQTTGDLFQRRRYLLENNAGNLLLMSVRLRKFKGQWYFSSMSVSNDKSVLDQITLPTP